ncbi:LacI family DNA-binding transcriptional regulator [Geminicoccaceae bacterium 1502E]|nr:LacI family DNA-binding transcriptional regulator [Geminicoccaceae bacterium 1502E]
MTSIDVARRAGVSASAVSRAFTEGAYISKELKARVMAAARELAYEPNPLARGLITRRSGMVALLMDELSNPFYPEALQAFGSELHRRGKRVMLFTPAPGEPLEDVLPQALRYSVDGIVVASAHVTSALAEAARSAPTPVVLFNRMLEHGGLSAVTCDNHAAADLVARLLAGAGHRRPAFIAGLETASTSIQRERGFAAGLQKAGLGAPRRVGGGYTYQGGYAAALELCRGGETPDAIFAANDIMALGVVDALRRELGLNVPDDVSVVGFDDIPAASWPSYDLTTMRQPLRAMVSETVQLLEDQLESAYPKATTVTLPGRLIRRGSARLPPA